MKLNKDIIQGFIAALLMSLFSLLVVINSKKNSEREISEINKILSNQEFAKQKALEDSKASKLSEKVANHKRDSALAILKSQQKFDFSLQQDLHVLKGNVLNLTGIFQKNIIELKNIHNEKDHIIDAPISEQSDYLSKYRYKEY